MTLSVQLKRRLGAFDIDASFQSSGGLTALFGPSGSGKTSVINMIGGLISPASGRVAVSGQVLVDTDAGIAIPRHKRRIGYVFQDARLFPHLTVGQNLRYGRWFTSPNHRYANLEGIVDLLGVGHLLDRRPAALSGGERQRIAIGRALAASPRLILMDEPLASLDEARKAEILPYIERLRDEMKIPIVYVSHSMQEVFRLATDLVVMDNGRVTAAGPIAEVALRTELLPQAEQAEAGAVLDMVVVDHDPAFDISLLRSAAGDMRVPGLGALPGAAVRLRIRARDIMLALDPPGRISGLNVLAGKVSAVGPPHGAHLDITIDCNGQPLVARITRLSAQALEISHGREVFAIVKSVSLDGATAAPTKRANTMEI